MCGIAGFVSNSSLPLSCIQGMTDIISYRGPDDEGFVFFEDISSLPVIAGGAATPPLPENAPSYFPSISIEACKEKNACIAFGHRRLSIVEISTLGHQPMSYKEGRYWIVYNGEIYNHADLRSQLIDEGFQFNSTSDTELILAAYDKWGADCLYHFNGMWAFAIYDTLKKKVFIARDRFGVKPLYYWMSPNGAFFFGSEIKQFTTLPGWHAHANMQRLYDYLAWGVTDHTHETMFSDVFHLAPGHYMSFGLNEEEKIKSKIHPVRWYNLKPAEQKTGDSALHFRDLLEDSVRLRLLADVPVGSCLSGGLDSSSIVCLIDSLLKMSGHQGKQKTFSACSKVSKYDERKWIDCVLTNRKIDAYYTYPTFENLLQDSKKIIWHQDEPYGSSSIHAQWKVFELASKNDVRVMLDGQGADEQLAGYHSYFGPKVATLLRKLKFKSAVNELSSMRRLYGYSWINLIGRVIVSLFPPYAEIIIAKISGKNSNKPSWLNVDLMNIVAASPFGRCVKDLTSLSRSQMSSTNLPMLLHWEDRDSMAHSVESRVPFLDYRIAEFTAGLPDNQVLKNGMTKVILRSAMDGIIPDEIRDRTDKIGFATPEQVWLSGEGRDEFRESIKEAIKISNGIINPSALDMFDQVAYGKKPFSFAIWRIICFANWVKIFSVHLQTRA